MSALALKRRSQHSQQHVRKSDIRMLDSRSSTSSRRASSFDAFQAAQSTGSGDQHDICYQRLTGWLNIVQNYQEYFKSMAAAELDLATVYARIGDILKVPLREGALFLPPDSVSGGVQAMTWRLKEFQQLMVENHCAISQAVRENAMAELGSLHEEVDVLMKTYVDAVTPMFNELQQCRSSIKQRAQVLATAIADPNSAKDPFIISLEVEALLRKRAELERRLGTQTAAQASVLAGAEPRLVKRIAAVVDAYVGVVSDRHRRLRVSAKRDSKMLKRVDGSGEWAAFADQHKAALSVFGQDKSPTQDYPGRGSESISVLRQGVVALREAGPLFRSTWQSKYGVLTTRGFFHVFRSQGDVVKGAPETSVYLPRARIVVSANTLQLSAGSKFSRCRIIIQDAPQSLDNWRLLMESTCNRSLAATATATASASGLATPPDSSADELSPCSSPLNVRALARRSAISKASKRQSLAAEHPMLETPTRRGRPFSANVSMLEQPSLRGFQFTPTHAAQLTPANQPSPFNIYMRPLDSTPLQMVRPISYCSAAHPYVAVDVHANGGVSDDANYEPYSPGFSSHSPLPDSQGSSSSSSGQMAAAESLLSRSVSQDTESGPLSGLPKPASIAGHAMRFEPLAAGFRQRRADFNADIWHSDVLRIPDPAAQTKQRPRSLLDDAPSAGLLDPTNPYLGDFLARRNVRGTRSSTASSALQTTLWRTSSSAYSQSSAPTAPSPPPMRMAVGPCKPSPYSSHESIPE
ncbi:hypothetical protein FB645_002176 [Coemansia sp. IMI 203386]|nr:hypothetical protein FB645_002176 [Coemansia sp. IMI 203386]